MKFFVGQMAATPGSQSVSHSEQRLVGAGRVHECEMREKPRQNIRMESFHMGSVNSSENESPV